MAVTVDVVLEGARVRLGKLVAFSEDERRRTAELALALVVKYAPEAPDAAAREAAIRVYGFLFQSPYLALRADTKGGFDYTPTRPESACR